MTVYSTRIRPTWTLSSHGQLRAYQRGIRRDEVLAAIEGTHYSRPSAVRGSGLRVVTGGNGVVAVVDSARRLVVTVYRSPGLAVHGWASPSGRAVTDSSS